jgi:hypothetical protein
MPTINPLVAAALKESKGPQAAAPEVRQSRNIGYGCSYAPAREENEPVFMKS